MLPHALPCGGGGVEGDVEGGDDDNVSDFDCQDCGACCCNSARNKSVGSRDYVEVERGDGLLDDREALRRLAERRDRRWFLKLVGDDERCVALDGEVGVRVACSVYEVRPRGCRLVTPGDDECRAARAQRGLATLT